MHSLCPLFRRCIQFAAQQSAYIHLGREGKERGRGAGKAASHSLREQMEMQC